MSLVGLLIAALVAAGGSTGATASTTSTPTIPQVNVSYGYFPCCADGDVPAVGIEKGFFKDVGINITPSGGAHFSDPSQVIPAMHRGTYDISTGGVSTYLDTLNTFAQTIPPTMFFDNYLGDMFLRAPWVKAKTVTQWMKTGLSFRAAAKKAMAEMKGQTLYTDPFSSTQPPFYNLFLSYAGLTTKDLHMVFLSDSKTLALSATPGRVDFTYPESGSVVTELLQNGWQPMIGDQLILQGDPHSRQAHELQGIVSQATLVTQLKMVQSSPDTVMRFISAVYRSIAYLQNPKTALAGDAIIAHIINATQGSTLSAKTVAGVLKNIDPIVGWNQQGSVMWSPKSPYYVPSVIKQQIASLVANGTMKAGNYDLKRFEAALPIYREMKADQVAAKSLIAKASSKSLTGAKATLLRNAKKYYSWYDFLDAKRFAQAAVG